MRIDLHTHSDVSDGTDPPADLVAHAAAAGLDVIALCDHDTFDGLPEAQDAGRRLGIEVVPGLEMSTLEGRTSVHLLAYGCRTDDPAHSARRRAASQCPPGPARQMSARLRGERTPA